MRVKQGDLLGGSSHWEVRDNGVSWDSRGNGERWSDSIWKVEPTFLLADGLDVGYEIKKKEWSCHQRR